MDPFRPHGPSSATDSIRKIDKYPCAQDFSSTLQFVEDFQYTFKEFLYTWTTTRQVDTSALVRTNLPLVNGSATSITCMSVVVQYHSFPTLYLLRGFILTECAVSTPKRNWYQDLVKDFTYLNFQLQYDRS